MRRIISGNSANDLLKAQEIVVSLALLPPVMAGQALVLLAGPPSQLKQDLFVLGQPGFARGRFSGEYGAADDLGLSNSWLLVMRFVREQDSDVNAGVTDKI